MSISDGIDESCDLCRLYHEDDIQTEFYNKDEVCIIVDCSRCGVPMAVYSKHNIQPSKRELEHMTKLLDSIDDGILDDAMRSIPDHYHIHLRSFEEL